MFGEEKKKINVISNKPIVVTIPKKLKNNLNVIIKHKLPLLAPLKENEPIAELIIKKKNTETILSKFDLYPSENVEKSNFLSKIYNNFKYLIFGDSIFTE